MNQIAHFAINADDVEATRRFYEGVFGWTFREWGPPEFYRIDMGDAPVSLIGVLQRRRTLKPGVQTHGFECTIAVASLDGTERLLREHGAEIVLERSTIPGVGHLLFFEDPGGNLVGAMEFDREAR